MLARSNIHAFWLVLAIACSSSEKKAEEQPVGAAQPSAPATVVHVGYQKIGSPFLLKTRAEGLQKRLQEQNAKLEWIEFQHGPALLEAMRAGAVDVGYTGETPPVFAQAGKVPFVYVAVEPPAPGAEAIIVPKDSPLKQLSDLRGKKVALNRGSNVHYLLLRALEKGNLKLDEVQVTFLSPADARTAFDSHQIDAWVIWDPFYAAAENAGARLLHDGTELVDNNQFYLARKEFAEQQPALLQTVLASFEELSQWASSHPEDVAKALSESSGIAYEALLRSEKRHSYGLRPITPEILARQQKIADAFHGSGQLPQAIETKEAFLAAANLTKAP